LLDHHTHQYGTLNNGGCHQTKEKKMKTVLAFIVLFTACDLDYVPWVEQTKTTSNLKPKKEKPAEQPAETQEQQVKEAKENA